MPTLTPGSSVEIDIPVGDSYAVTTPGEAYVDIVSGTLGAGYKTDRLVGGTQREQVYGPYPTAVKIRVRARTGGATYFKAPTETKDALDVVDLKAKITSSGGIEFSDGDLSFGVPKILSPSFTPSIVLTLTAAATYSQSGNTVTVSSTGHGAPNRSSSYRFFWPGSAAIPQGWYDGWKYVSADVFTFENPKSQSVSAGTAITGSAKSMYVPVASLFVPERLFSDGTLLTFEAFMSCDATAAAKTARAQVNGTPAGYFSFVGVSCFGKRDLSIAFRSDRWFSAPNNDGVASMALSSAIFNAAGGATVDLCAYSPADSAAMMFDSVKAVLK